MEIARYLYCHLCKIEFQCQDQNKFNCQSCNSEFCEEINNQISDDPRKFTPYGEENITQIINEQQQQQQQITSNRNQQNMIETGRNMQNSGQNQRYQPSTIRINNTRPNIGFNFQGLLFNQIFSQLFPNSFQNIQQQQDNYFSQILDYIMRNDQNQYGSPPASQQSIENLQKIKFQKKIDTEELNECSVCKDLFQTNEEVIQMPCKHIFHNECLIPWLKQHNSCPVCRYELPTNDQEYELRKQQNGYVQQNNSIIIQDNNQLIMQEEQLQQQQQPQQQHQQQQESQEQQPQNKYKNN